MFGPADRRSMECSGCFTFGRRGLRWRHLSAQRISCNETLGQGLSAEDERSHVTQIRAAEERAPGLRAGDTGEAA